MNQKGFSNTMLLFIVIGIVIVGVGSYLTFISTSNDKQVSIPVDVTKPTDDTKPVTQPPVSDSLNKDTAIISVDKTAYDEGEIIKIVVNNNLDTPILYYSGGDRFWGIEYLKDGEWIDPSYEEGGGFQLTDENIGSACYVALYERMPPIELKSGDNISHQWNQKICPFGTASPTESRIVSYIESGQYRLTFNYGFEISDDDPYRLSDFKTVYSDSFTIR